MNRKKVFSLIGLSIILSTASIFAANNEKGIEYYRAELYEAAKIFFLQQSNQSVREKAENNYYLGETYYQIGQKDSAFYYYEKAIEIDPEYPFGYIGEGKLELNKKNPKGAEDLFKKANGFAKKNPSVQTTIAEVYVEIGDYDNAKIAIDKARKVNSKYSGIYLVEGDMLMKQGKTGDACARYENAILFNNSDKVAYLKLAQIYKTINVSVALQYLDKLVALDPNYIPAYAIIGDINREKGMYKKALDAYEKFIAIEGVPLLQHERYAQLLYFTEQYQEALDQIKYVLLQDPNNLVMKRLEAYNSFRLENYTLSLEQMNRFLEAMPVERHIYQDYTTLARVLLKEKQAKQALDAFQKAVAIDSTKTDTYKEMASTALSAALYPEAINYYEKYFEVGSGLESMDYYFYGQANHMAASYYIVPENMASATTPEAVVAYETDFKNYIQKGDSAFEEVTKRVPASHIGYLWRGNINALRDKYEGDKTGKVEGHAKPYFEEALTIMLAKNENGARNREIIEVYRYFASYYYSIEDTASVIEYNKKILEINPNDELAKKTLTLLKVKY